MGSKRLNQQEVLKRFREVHGDRYDYSKVEFVNVDKKICIVCPEHGEFWQTPYKHINRKQGCPFCAKNVKFSKEKFIEESLKTHTIKYDYSNIRYENAQKEVEIICPKHGAFFQKANLHKRGGNCPLCVGGVKDTTETFIKKAKEIKGEVYDYSKVVYKDTNTKVEIGCPKHGFFFVKPSYHLNQIFGGCPKCKESNGEKIIRSWLEKNNINFVQEFKFEECKDINQLPFDFFIPSENLLIEFQGKQHYKPYELFGGKKQFTKQKKHDNIKRKFCKKNNYKLLEIPYYSKNIYKILEENIETSKN